MPDNQQPQAYRPFSNSSEFDHWTMSNCYLCQYGAEGESSPRCCGEYGLLLAMIGDGTVPVMALDFIGTQERKVTDNGAYCTLKRDCDQFEMAGDEDEESVDGISINKGMALKDAELSETIAEAYDKHGYSLSSLIRQLV